MCIIFINKWKHKYLYEKWIFFIQMKMMQRKAYDIKNLTRENITWFQVKFVIKYYINIKCI